VRIDATPTILRVVVTDDGIGCDNIDPGAAGGISHMHTRAALIGARLRIGRVGRKGGTRVAIEITRSWGAAVSPASEAPFAAMESL
jgi:signal transduction histidine kinase